MTLASPFRALARPSPHPPAGQDTLSWSEPMEFSFREILKPWWGEGDP